MAHPSQQARMHAERGRAALDTGLYSAAAAAYESAVRLAPGHPRLEAYRAFSRTMAHLDSERRSRSHRRWSTSAHLHASERLIRRSIALSPDFADGFVLLARLYLVLGAPERALQLLDAARALEPDHRNAASFLETAQRAVAARTTSAPGAAPRPRRITGGHGRRPDPLTRSG